MIVAVAMVRDEADIIGYTLAHMLAQVDHVVVADNRSTDGTRDILESFDRVTVIDDPEPGYWQADKMTRLAHQAGDMGADWVVPFDADEAWFLPDLDSIDGNVFAVRPFVYVPQTDDQSNPDPIERIVHRQPTPEPFDKVFFRYHPEVRLEMGNHGVSWPGAGWLHRAGRVRHYQYRTVAQVRRKIRNGVEAYNATTLPATEGAHWRQLAQLDADALTAWWHAYINQPLVCDP